MGDFHPRTAELTGGFSLGWPVEPAFELFSPLGEKRWVPGWSPELLHPRGAEWGTGLIFRTPGERGDAVWIVTEHDSAAKYVRYERLEAGRYVARVSVRCTARGAGETEVQVSYSFFGLSEAGNDEIAGMTPAAFAQKMQQWQRWIEAIPPSSIGPRPCV